MKDGSGSKEMEDQLVYKCMSVKRSMTDLLFRTDIDRTLVSRMIEDFNYGLLLSKNKEDRKLGLIYGSFLLSLLFKSSSTQIEPQAPSDIDQTLHFTGPFSRTGSLVFLNFDKHAFEQNHRSIQLKTLSPYHKDLKQQHIIFNYVLTSLSGDRSMLIGVSIDRIFDILSKPKLIECIPDPKETCVFFNTRQGNRLQMEDIIFEHLDYRAWSRKYYSDLASSEFLSMPFLKGNPGLNFHTWGDGSRFSEKTTLDLSTIETTEASPQISPLKAGGLVFLDSFKFRPKTLQEIPSTFPKEFFLKLDSANLQGESQSSTNIAPNSLKRKADSCAKRSQIPSLNARDRLPNITSSKQKSSRKENNQARARLNFHRQSPEAESPDYVVTSQKFILKRKKTRSEGRRLLGKTEPPIVLKAVRFLGEKKEFSTSREETGINASSISENKNTGDGFTEQTNGSSSESPKHKFFRIIKRK